MNRHVLWFFGKTTITLVGFVMIWLGVHSDVATIAAIGGILFGAGMVAGLFLP